MRPLQRRDRGGSEPSRRWRWLVIASPPAIVWRRQGERRGCVALSRGSTPYWTQRLAGSRSSPGLRRSCLVWQRWTAARRKSMGRPRRQAPGPPPSSSKRRGDGWNGVAAPQIGCFTASYSQRSVVLSFVVSSSPVALASMPFLRRCCCHGGLGLMYVALLFFLHLFVLWSVVHFLASTATSVV